MDLIRANVGLDGDGKGTFMVVADLYVSGMTGDYRVHVDVPLDISAYDMEPQNQLRALLDFVIETFQHRLYMSDFVRPGPVLHI